MQIQEIKNITKDTFSKYGIVISQSDNSFTGCHFEILALAESAGWRIGYLLLEKNYIKYMERHMKTKEVYEPVTGTTLLLITSEKDNTNIEIFLLDKAVSINEGIWHQVVAISEISSMRIVENIEVPDYESETMSFSF